MVIFWPFDQKVNRLLCNDCCYLLLSHFMHTFLGIFRLPMNWFEIKFCWHTSSTFKISNSNNVTLILVLLFNYIKNEWFPYMVANFWTNTTSEIWGHNMFYIYIVLHNKILSISILNQNMGDIIILLLSCRSQRCVDVNS